MKHCQNEQKLNIFFNMNLKNAVSHLMNCIESKKITLGLLFPNICKLLCISETIAVYSIVEFLSKVKLIVIDHRNRFNVLQQIAHCSNKY